jgi:hypothetical protein
MSLVASANYLYYHSDVKLTKIEREAVYQYLLKIEQRERMNKPIMNELQIYECRIFKTK